MNANTTVETRRESYQDILSKRGDRRNLILEVLGEREMTVSEITQEFLKKGYIKYYDRNFVAPRLTELKSAGIVKTVGRRPCDMTGKNIAIWARCSE